MSIPEQFIQNLAEQCEPIPASPSPLRLSGQWLIEAIIYIGVSLLYLGVRPDIKLQLQSPSFYVEFFLLSTLIIMASFSAAALSYPDLYQRRKLIYLPFFTMALLVTFLLIQWQMTTHVTHAPSHTWQCLLSITLLAVLPAGRVFYAIRKMASTHYRLAGITAMLFSLAIGSFVIGFSELNGAIAHAIQWHYLPIICISFAGLWLGKKYLTW